MPRVETQIRLPRPLVITVVLVCAALITVIVGFMVYLRIIATSGDDQQFKELLSETNLMGADAKYDQAAQLWVTYASQTPSKSHKYAAYISAATAYLNDREFQKSVTMCNRAESVAGITYPESQAAALAYRSLGNKSKAVYYYHEAIILTPADEFNRSMQIKFYQQAITALLATS